MSLDLFEVSTPDESRGAEVTARQMLDRGAERIGAELQTQPLVQVSLMQVIGSAYAKLGLNDSAVNTLETALERYEASETEDDPILGLLLHNLGVVYHSEARHEESAQMLNRALTFRRRVLGPIHGDIAATLQSLASLAHELDEYDKATDYLNEAETIVRSLDPPEFLALANVLRDRADLTNKLGDYDGAITTLSRSHRVKTRNLRR